MFWLQGLRMWLLHSLYFQSIPTPHSLHPTGSGHYYPSWCCFIQWQRLTFPLSSIQHTSSNQNLWVKVKQIANGHTIILFTVLELSVRQILPIEVDLLASIGISFISWSPTYSLLHVVGWRDLYQTEYERSHMKCCYYSTCFSLASLYRIYSSYFSLHVRCGQCQYWCSSLSPSIHWPFCGDRFETSWTWP